MRVRNYFIIALAVACGASCKKVVSIITPAPTSSLTVVNALDGSNGFLTTFWHDSAVATFYSTGTEINYASSTEYSVPSGTSPVLIYDLSDTAEPLFSGNLTFQPKAIYSLFVSGALTVHSVPDTLLVQDDPPYHPVGDSTVGIRFVNVSPDAGTISVDIKGNSPGSEVTSLGYQGVSAFKNYAATSAIPTPSVGYVFEFRVASTDSVLCTYTYRGNSIPRFKNVSLVVAGTVVGSGIRVFEVNNY